MEIDFDEVPSSILIAKEKPKNRTVLDELESAQELLKSRTTRCSIIKPLFGKLHHKKPFRFCYKLIAVCPRFRPRHYCCKHSDNLVLDRDILTSREHIEFLSMPRCRPSLPYGGVRFYYKATVAPDCTARVARLAKPHVQRVRNTLQDYGHVLKPRNLRSLKKRLQPPNPVEYTNIGTALAYMEEERRLQRVAKRIDAQRCKRLKRKTLEEKRKMIRKMVCTVFHELKEFLMNDKFIVDEKSTLCEYILQQLRHENIGGNMVAPNLYKFQYVLASNLTVWINKFIEGLKIHLKPPQIKHERPDPETFLPVGDYVSVSSAGGEEAVSEMLRSIFEGDEEAEEFSMRDIVTDDTIKN